MGEESTMPSQFAFRTSKTFIATAPAEIGHLAVATVGPRLAGVSMAHASGPQAASRLARLLGETLEPAEISAAPDEAEVLALDVLDRLVRFLDGEPVELADVPLALDHLSPFQRRIVAACRAIPFGRTRTYGDLAAAAGSPGAARAVGQVMAGNRMPLVVPCHRVVAAGGKLGGFSAPSGLTLKRRLLALESAGDASDLWQASSRKVDRRPARLG
jgi:methylated-DNA-[protein]-cysteine S-methyltransferase